MKIKFALCLLCLSATPCMAMDLGQSIPALTLSSPEGKAIQLSELKGKVIYLDFWASWCPPCRHSLPWVSKLKDRFATDNFEVVAINLDSERESAERALKELGTSVKVALDPEGNSPRAFGLVTMPSSFLIDQHGKVVAIHEGFHEESKHAIESEIEKLLRS